jgi:outer membrane lipoprotein-sorting protein
MKNRILCALSLLIFIAGSANAVGLSARQILERASRRYDAVHDYTADAVISFQSQSIHVPEMKIQIYFKKPDKLRVESKEGLALLPKQGLVLGNPLRDMLAGSDLRLAGSARISGIDCYVIRGTYGDSMRPMQSTVWIDSKDLLVRRVSAKQALGPSYDVSLQYMKVNGHYWMPSYTQARVPIRIPQNRQYSARPNPMQPTVIKIAFTNYRVNIGLDDKVFVKQEGEN